MRLVRERDECSVVKQIHRGLKCHSDCAGAQSIDARLNNRATPAGKFLRCARESVEFHGRNNGPGESSIKHARFIFAENFAERKWGESPMEYYATGSSLSQKCRKTRFHTHCNSLSPNTFIRWSRWR